VDDGEGGAGIVQDMLERRSLQRRVHRHIDRAEIVDREHDPQRQWTGWQYQHHVIMLADAQLVQIAGKACDLLQSLRKGPAFATLEGGKDLVRLYSGVAFQGIAQDADVGWIGAARHIVGR
jgi:hypothetical protein